MATTVAELERQIRSLLDYLNRALDGLNDLGNAEFGVLEIAAVKALIDAQDGLKRALSSVERSEVRADV